MSRIYLIILLLFPISGFTQNYQCLQPGVKNYFVNKSGYLRGIRIDSAKSYADSTVYFPYHTPRGRYLLNRTLDSTGGSWLGKKVLQLSDGTTFFDNIWNDTVIIKTQANPGDTWVFYNDTTKLYYQAELLSSDTMTLLGTIDSVKRILITARDPFGIVTTDLADSFQILISKNNGFAQVFDLYNFPYHAPDSAYIKGLDYYTDYLVSRYTLRPDWSFSLIDLINPTMKDLYQWKVGDIFEYSSCDGYFEHTRASCYPVEHYISDTITSVSTTGTDVTYTVNRSKMDHIRISTGLGYVDGPPFYEKSTSIHTVTFNLTPIFNLTLMPEEHNQKTIYYYQPGDTGFCRINTLYVLQYNNEIWRNEYRPIFEHASGPSLYKAPFGLLNYYSSGVGYYGRTFIVYSHALTYYNSNGVSCGEVTYPATKIDELSPEIGKIDLFPNPVTDLLTVNSTSKITSIDIFNLLGQTLYSGKYNHYEIKVNISDLPSGVYLTKINKTEMKKFIKQ